MKKQTNLISGRWANAAWRAAAAQDVPDGLELRDHMIERMAQLHALGLSAFAAGQVLVIEYFDTGSFRSAALDIEEAVVVVRRKHPSVRYIEAAWGWFRGSGGSDNIETRAGGHDLLVRLYREGVTPAVCGECLAAAQAAGRWP
ncbi:MAG: hypothetical protein Q8O67_17070 [Deltaproteobacteria bacterium]|nr:hypothetical protein [Deltaproteobacteria bacterium]